MAPPRGSQAEPATHRRPLGTERTHRQVLHLPQRLPRLRTGRDLPRHPRPRPLESLCRELEDCPGLKRRLRDIPGHLSFDDLKAQVDAILLEMGIHLMLHRYPDARFGPWKQLHHDRQEQIRPAHTNGTMAPMVGPRTLDGKDDKYKAMWTIHMPGEAGTAIEGKAWSINAAIRAVDKKMVELGFDLAHPEAFDLLAMRRGHDRRKQDGRKKKAEKEQSRYR